MAVKVIRRRAFAKINLALQVLGTRDDGYHELRTLFQSVTLHDTLTVRASRGPFRLTSNDPRCPADETNLIWRAAAALWTSAKRSGDPRGVTIHLTKRIPMQAGLGGGSSDAAVALFALASIWRIGMTQVGRVAAALGADVPYFLEGGTALGVGRGDVIVPLVDIRPAWVVVVVPSFGISTRDAFGWWDKARGKRRTGTLNDLQPAVSAHHPEIERLVSGLERRGARSAAMTGSGSAVFGLFDRRTEAASAARALGRRGRPAVVTRTVDRAAYQRLAGIRARQW